MVMQTRRRIMFTNGAKEIVMNPLHARIPIHTFKRGNWVNLCIDVVGFSNFCFKGSTFRSIELVKLQAFCRLRKIFTMKSPIIDTVSEY
jgi:hypothetical protein